MPKLSHNPAAQQPDWATAVLLNRKIRSPAMVKIRNPVVAIVAAAVPVHQHQYSHPLHRNFSL
ncbi:hypothetical protein J8J42_02650 [Chryseobacterium sp. cx-311]|uniref:hypothetical protein n=1 Tax=Marnyiella aurantia TaxID=2758037 RepID=UPI001AEB4464|nr:hypothetical protein [Marnyiella aurantia]MBP0611943.1 hypothetical protein [Marnyiella aurantia]